jgi:hypothetical protein
MCGLVQGHRRQEGSLTVPLGDHEPAYRHPGEQVLEEQLLERLHLERLVAVERQPPSPLAEVLDRERIN